MKKNYYTLGAVTLMLLSLYVTTDYRAKGEGVRVGYIIGVNHVAHTLNIAYTRGYQQAMQDSLNH
jgi:hypothetical protein